ncbi:toll/interleukin-1 receptor domain-containing protein [Streptomyces justiciae]|uniref:toll/interleukin-1 receptor domain-containing protein n=1 Tax=Streptomyces justiciae TaxID=2780140 RepID=UPI001880E56F|nr:toll/interleukin-1 receptor domain-containing protein [Streptomyces justiciae]MBE8470271.1 toll/interleukin-1 receptor domain-containing protein [Streptomyces justiciae]MCW8376503.1 toll/interleukin-1 receptor domain-containing protein [Streptomyces justiciae]
MGEQGFSLFYSYAHEDEALRDELSKHLRTMERQGVIRGWHDREISAGAQWQGEIDRNLGTADVVLLLVSPDFMASDYCHDVEMTEALRRHDLGECVVIPVLLRPVDLVGAPFMSLQALPSGARPVTSWGDRDDAFADVAAGIRRAVTRLAAEDRPRRRDAVEHELTPARSRDLDRIRGYRHLLDRPAFAMPCIFEASLEAVDRACNQISLAMLTGQVRTPAWEGNLYEIAKRSEFETEPFVSSLDRIRHHLAALERAVAHLHSHLAAPDKVALEIGKRAPGTDDGKIWHMEFYLGGLISSGSVSQRYVRDAIELMDRVDVGRNAILRVANELFGLAGLAELPPVTLSSRLIELSADMRPYDWDHFYVRTHAELSAFLAEEG